MRIDGFVMAGLFTVLAMVRTAAALPAERQRDTLDALLLTGWYTSDVVDSMYAGLMRALRPYLLVSGLAMIAARRPRVSTPYPRTPGHHRW